MNVVAYLRVSGQAQVEGDGFPRQQESVDAFCRAQGLTLKRTLREEGVSGVVEGLDRPAFVQILEFIESQRGSGGEEVGAIVVERMDRLARDLMVSEMLLKECRIRKIKVFSADQGALIDMASDDGDPTRVLIRQLMGALAQWEKSMLVKKLYAARKRTGRWGGHLKYGAKAGEKRVIQFMQGARAQGRSYEEVASEMNALEMPSRHGKTWGKKTVARILGRLNAPTLHSVEKPNVETTCTA